MPGWRRRRRVALALVLFAAVVSPLVLCGQSDLLSAHRLLLGRPVGGLVNVALLILALLYGAGEMTGLAAFLAESSDFSPRLGALALLLVALYAAGRGLLCLGRGSEILWAVLLALLALFFLLPLSQLRPELLLPVARTPWRTIVREGVGTLLEWFLPAYFLLALLGDTPRRSDLFPALFRAVLTAGVALVLAVAYNIMALGALASESDYPAYLTAALIEIGQFVRRPEALIAGVQVLGALFRLSIYLLFAARAWESVCPRGAHRRRVLAMGGGGVRPVCRRGDGRAGLEPLCAAGPAAAHRPAGAGALAHHPAQTAQNAGRRRMKRVIQARKRGFGAGSSVTWRNPRASRANA